MTVETTPPSATIISGFLGAGKTTLLNHLLTSCVDRRVGVLVNDFGSIGIDNELIVGVDGDVITLANGCICCTIKNDVVQGVLQLLGREDAPEHIIVETSGVSDPGTVAQTFLDLQRQGHLRLDGIVVVVDAETFCTSDPDTGLLARCQVLAADLAIINKVDLVDEARLDAVLAEIEARAPGTPTLQAQQGRVPVEALLCLEASGPREVPVLDLHVHEASDEHDDHDHGDHGAHGGLQFSTWSYTSSRPLSFKALAPTLNELPGGVYRVKGFVVLAERPGDRLVLHVAGRRLYVRTVEEGTDRRDSVLVFIGRQGSFDAEALRAQLDACRT